MVRRLAVMAVGAVAVALYVVSGVGAQGRATAVTTTSHPPVPADPSLYWLVPQQPASASSTSSSSSGAARQVPAIGLTQFARGVALLADEDFAGGLALVNNAAVGATPLAQYARYYAGVALLGLGRADEAATTLAALDGRVEGYLKEALPLRMAEAALARDDPEGAVGILELASDETLVAARRGADAPRRRAGGGGRARAGASGPISASTTSFRSASRRRRQRLPSRC